MKNLNIQMRSCSKCMVVARLWPVQQLAKQVDVEVPYFFAPFMNDLILVNMVE